jgi:hypothetical protein
MTRSYPPFSAIEHALDNARWAARSRGLSLKHMELVADSAESEGTLGVIFFYENDVDVKRNLENGMSEWLRLKFLEELDDIKERYCFSDLPKTTFEFDSAENVRVNFQGNYFLRLR